MSAVYKQNGFDPSLFVDDVSSYICGICNNVCRRVYDFDCKNACNHRFCSKCIKQASNDPLCIECPVCHRSYKSHDLSPHTKIDKQIEQLKLHCPNKCNGCCEVLTIGKKETILNTHLVECQFKKPKKQHLCDVVFHAFSPPNPHFSSSTLNILTDALTTYCNICKEDIPTHINIQHFQSHVNKLYDKYKTFEQQQTAKCDNLLLTVDARMYQNYLHVTNTSQTKDDNVMKKMDEMEKYNEKRSISLQKDILERVDQLMHNKILQQQHTKDMSSVQDKYDSLCQEFKYQEIQCNEMLQQIHQHEEHIIDMLFLTKQELDVKTQSDFQSFQKQISQNIEQIQISNTQRDQCLQQCLTRCISDLNSNVDKTAKKHRKEYDHTLQSFRLSLPSHEDIDSIKTQTSKTIKQCREATEELVFSTRQEILHEVYAQQMHFHKQQQQNVDLEKRLKLVETTKINELQTLTEKHTTELCSLKKTFSDELNLLKQRIEQMEHNSDSSSSTRKRKAPDGDMVL